MYTLKLTLVAFVLASLALFQGTTALAAPGDYNLFGDAEIISGGNPGNAAQLRSDSDPGFGGVDFDTAAGMTVSQLTNLSTDYNFTQASCGGGAPRFQINATNGTVSGNIFVYIGPPPNYTLCPMNTWTPTGNLVTPASLVDATQLGGTFYMPWSAVVLAYGSYDTYTFDAAPTKDSCKKGGWEEFTSSPGPFKNQGDCVSHFASGKNDTDE
jgi:hypothetical protein